MIRSLVVVLALLAGGAQVAWGQGLVGASPVEWSRLAPAQRSALAPLERDWSRITPAQQLKWLDVANRFGSMPPDERARMQQRMGAWSRLSPQERARARLNFQEARQLSPAERQQQWEAYRSLPADQRRALGDRTAPAAQSPRNAARAEPPAATEKSNVVRAPAAAPARPVGPAVVQRGAGATTNLVSKPAQPPLHQQAGLPKVAATPGFVDAATLLPQRGAQGAAARPAPRDERKKNGKDADR
jgi:hypothetical protein